MCCPTHFVLTDPILRQVRENQHVQLEFSDPHTGRPYDEIWWSKGSRRSRDTRIALLHPDITGGDILYYNKYCSGNDPCETSEKVKLDANTGSLTINQVQLSDEGYYYYRFFIDVEGRSYGHK